jgi:hypothetical protein
MERLLLKGVCSEAVAEAAILITTAETAISIAAAETAMLIATVETAMLKLRR